MRGQEIIELGNGESANFQSGQSTTPLHHLFSFHATGNRKSVYETQRARNCSFVRHRTSIRRALLLITSVHQHLASCVYQTDLGAIKF